MINFFNFRLFLNFVRKNKTYAAINIFGFSVSIAFILLLGSYIRKERSVDNFHEKKDRIFVMAFQEQTALPGPMGPDLQNTFPEVESFLRITSMPQEIYDLQSMKLRENVLYADTTLFSFFSLKFREGHPQTALRTSDNIVLTESFARKMFGNSPAVGNTLRFEDDKEYIIGGVIEDMKNSHLINPGVILHVRNYEDHLEQLFGMSGALTNGGISAFVTYLMASPHTSLPALAANMEDYLVNSGRYHSLSSGSSKNLHLLPLEEMYFSSQAAQTEFLRSNDWTFISVLVITAFLILFFAVINYINLSVAQAGFRAKESSVRRLLGGTKSQLFAGFISESVLICLTALVIGVVLAILLQPVFQHVMRTDSGILPT